MTGKRVQSTLRDNEDEQAAPQPSTRTVVRAPLADISDYQPYADWITANTERLIKQDDWNGAVTAGACQIYGDLAPLLPAERAKSYYWTLFVILNHYFWWEFDTNRYRLDFHEFAQFSNKTDSRGRLVATHLTLKSADRLGEHSGGFEHDTRLLNAVWNLLLAYHTKTGEMHWGLFDWQVTDDKTCSLILTPHDRFVRVERHVFRR